jgi:hypothetical protein
MLGYATNRPPPIYTLLPMKVYHITSNEVAPFLIPWTVYGASGPETDKCKTHSLTMKQSMRQTARNKCQTPDVDSPQSSGHAHELAANACAIVCLLGGGGGGGEEVEWPRTIRINEGRDGNIVASIHSPSLLKTSLQVSNTVRYIQSSPANQTSRESTTRCIHSRTMCTIVVSWSMDDRQSENSLAMFASSFASASRSGSAVARSPKCSFLIIFRKVLIKLVKLWAQQRKEKQIL